MLVHLKWLSLIFSRAVFLRPFKLLFTDEEIKSPARHCCLYSQTTAFSASGPAPPPPALTPPRHAGSSLCVCLCCPDGSLTPVALSFGRGTAWVSVGPAWPRGQVCCFSKHARPIPVGTQTSGLDGTSVRPQGPTCRRACCPGSLSAST